MRNYFLGWRSLWSEKRLRQKHSSITGKSSLVKTTMTVNNGKWIQLSNGSPQCVYLETETKWLRDVSKNTGVHSTSQYLINISLTCEISQQHWHIKRAESLVSRKWNAFSWETERGPMNKVHFSSARPLIRGSLHEMLRHRSSLPELRSLYHCCLLWGPPTKLHGYMHNKWSRWLVQTLLEINTWAYKAHFIVSLQF